MKILVDELPSCCEKCMFCTDSEVYINDYQEDCIECKCGLLREWNKDGLWDVHEKCPLISIRENLSIEIDKYDEWEDVMIKVKVNLCDNTICESNTKIGDSGWDDY